MAVTGRILSVRFEDSLPAATSRGVKVQGLHWTPSLAPTIADSDGSRKPAIYQKGEKPKALVDVELAGTSNTGAQGTLSATLGGLTLTGSIPLTDGRRTVTVTGQAGTAIQRHVGMARWSVLGSSLPNPAVLSNQTLLEVFVVLGPPPSFFANGIWAEALRFLVNKVFQTAVSEKLAAIEKITKFCHSGHGLRYTSGAGHTTFNITRSGGKFALSSLLEAAEGVTVNCFDISAAVLILGGAVGITVQWLQIPSFGYIAKTKLVGIGDCNNPFFTHFGTEPVVERDSSFRSRFEFHAFCQVENKIFDACVGPHLGITPPQTYLNGAVDDFNFEEEDIPSASDIMQFTQALGGVTWRRNRLDKFRQLVNLQDLLLPDELGEGVVADWLDQLKTLSRQGWDLFFQNAWPEAGGGVSEWALRRGRTTTRAPGREQLNVKIYVSSLGVGRARSYFRRLAMSSTAPELPYKVDKDPSGEVVTFFASSRALNAETHDDSLLRVYRNVVFDLRAYNAESDIRKIADDLLDFARNHLGATLLGRPELKPAQFEDGEVRVELPVAPDPFGDFRDTSLDVRVKTRGSVDFLGFDEEKAKFRSTAPPERGRIRVQVVDRRTLLSRTINLKVPQ